MDTITGCVIGVKRHGHTKYGNPTMSIALDAYPLVWWRIQDNAGLVYEIENPEFREREHTFYVTKARRISHQMTDWEAKAVNS